MIKTLLTTAAFALGALQAFAGDAPMSFDVAEDHTRFVFASQPVRESGMPAHGNPFVTQGYIYPAGTLKGSDAGVTEEGAPLYPDLVLGTWTCDGWFVGDGGDTQSGVWLVSRQIYAFDNGEVLITQGTEIADVDLANARPITGAIGAYADIEGVVEQTLLGFTEHFGVNARFQVVPTDEPAEIEEAALRDQMEDELFED
ncbi:MAG: hypothetical protein AAFX00_07685 [Pseudomonadota bacterium]